MPLGEVETRDKAYQDAAEPYSRTVQQASNTQFSQPPEMPDYLKGNAGPMCSLQLARCLYFC